MNRIVPILALTLTIGAAVVAVAQEPTQAPDSPARAASQGLDRPTVALPEGPQVFADSEGQPFRVVPIKGLRQPWALAFLPNGDILVTELKGGLRIIRNGVLDPQPIAGVPEFNTRVWRAGLMDVAVHPRYAENKFVYLTYSKSEPRPPGASPGQQQTVIITLARARFEGSNTLTDVKDVFVSDAKCTSACGARIAFAKDGTIIMAIGKPGAPGSPGGPGSDNAQNPGSHGGKILRLNEDGTVPKDNPFIGRAGYRPEIYALGVRNPIGLFVHPQTGEIWETEHGPMGGDEINIIRPGRNYGWPVISYGSDYTGRPTGGLGPALADRRQEGMEEPFLFWNPSPAVAGIVVYTGDKFPAWKGNIFVGAMGAGSHLGARQLHRIVLNRDGLPQRGGDWTMLYELKRRIRDVKQGPDGLLYVTVDAVDGAVLRIEPALN
jgi:glucose/arabinose dehydrogenase